MDATGIIAVAAVVLSALTFVATQFGGKRIATASYVAQLERRIEVLEAELHVKEQEITRLSRENVDLMRQLVRRTT